VTASCDVLAPAMGTDECAIEAATWSLSLISKTLIRTITEGSTIVMKAIETNSAKRLQKAVQGASRGERAGWLLKVQVGNQSISPLLWSISSGCLEAASAIIQDLLTIRADRERYYFGVDELFGHHPDIIKVLIDDGPTVLPTLWKHLVWRCHTVGENRMRRVNYYIKHLIIDKDRNPSPTLNWICEYAHPPTMLDELLILTNDILWTKLAAKKFAFRKAWFVFSLTVFMLSQVILPKLENAEDLNIRYAILVGRLISYGFILLRLLLMHVKHCCKSFRQKKYFKICRCIPVPNYLKDAYDFASFLLCFLLILMLALEPMLHCYLTQAPGDPESPTEICAESKSMMFSYSFICMVAVGVQWFLIVDMAVFSTQLSAFMLVIQYVMGELTRFMVALGFVLLMFGSAISVLKHDQEEMQTMLESAVALFAITVKLYQDDYRGIDEPALIVVAFGYQTAVSILLLNLLIAQLQCSYEYIHQDAIGMARLTRSKVITEVTSSISKQQWDKFVDSLEFDKKLEFSEGDVGVSGGIQMLERGNAHPLVTDTILRYGGSCAPSMPWPSDTATDEVHEEDQFDRLEKLLQKTIKRMAQVDSSSRQDSSRQHSGTLQSGSGSQRSSRSGSLGSD